MPETARLTALPELIDNDPASVGAFGLDTSTTLRPVEKSVTYAYLPETTTLFADEMPV